MTDHLVAEQPTSEQRVSAVEALVRVLDLEYLEEDLFRGAASPNERGRAFGGQVAAQALMAATRTASEGFHVHSLHSYFLLPGDPAAPIIYDVERIRDGRSFQTRRVVARQHGRTIYFQTVSFQVTESGFEHQDRMPDVPAPESCQDFFGIMRDGGPEAKSLAKEWEAVEVRAVGTSKLGLPANEDRPSQQRVWLRIGAALPDDPHLQAAAFTWSSDISLLGATLAAHTLDHSKVMMASLDHAIWFHRPFRTDDWWLYDEESPSAQGGRGLAFGRVFSQDGTLVATTAQEGLIRPLRPH